jgi:hypothetical protein
MKRNVYVVINTHIKKVGSQIKTLSLHLKEQEKQEQIKPQISRRKETI